MTGRGGHPRRKAGSAEKRAGRPPRLTAAVRLSRFSKGLSKGIPLAEHPPGGQKQEAGQPIPEEGARPQPAQVPALIGRAELNHAVHRQGEQQRRGPEGPGMAQPPGRKSRQNPRQLTRAAGADRKLLSLIEEGAVRPAVAPAEDGEPLVEPGLKASTRQCR